MGIISIIGAPGVGKSFLVKQLSTLECAPAFFEGEEGTIPQEILDFWRKPSPIRRFQWFVDRHKTIFEKAEKISKSGINCYVDGAPISIIAHIKEEKKKFWPELENIVSQLDNIKIDKIILITASIDKIKDLVLKRARKTEQNEKTIAKFIKIQEEFKKLAKKDKNIIVIDRTNFDFSKELDLKKIIEKINN